ncbi:hypothetical protein LCGC14_1558620 [marine sediment metagenome]|uniref:Uncharacterized protein n=1 Tax=marine sediment metagenome TaxID=412755 RepID=A0A0F9IN98_9ZZZZ
MTQINNLTIKWSTLYEKWQVITPGKQVWDEFEHKADAENYARETTDFKKQ